MIFSKYQVMLYFGFICYISFVLIDIQLCFHLFCYLFWYQVMICCFGICFDIKLWFIVLLLVLISSYGLLFCICWYFYIKLIFVFLVFFISSYDLLLSYLFWYQVMIFLCQLMICCFVICFDIKLWYADRSWQM